MTFIIAAALGAAYNPSLAEVLNRSICAWVLRSVFAGTEANRINGNDRITMAPTSMTSCDHSEPACSPGHWMTQIPIDLYDL